VTPPGIELIASSTSSIHAEVSDTHADHPAATSIASVSSAARSIVTSPVPVFTAVAFTTSEFECVGWTSGGWSVR